MCGIAKAISTDRMGDREAGKPGHRTCGCIRIVNRYHTISSGGIQESSGEFPSFLETMDAPIQTAQEIGLFSCLMFL